MQLYNTIQPCRGLTTFMHEVYIAIQLAICPAKSHVHALVVCSYMRLRWYSINRSIQLTIASQLYMAIAESHKGQLPITILHYIIAIIIIFTLHVSFKGNRIGTCIWPFIMSANGVHGCQLPLWIEIGYFIYNQVTTLTCI